MIAIELRFITGRYHATPWGRQVNEGAVEWPPSPWRILRSLIATWHLKYPEVPRDRVRILVERLSMAPVYRLPHRSSGHLRHYMPTKNDEKTKVFDTFVVVSRKEPLVVCWPDVELEEPQRTLLSQLVSAMNYFGRAESWVEARLSTSVPDPINARPLGQEAVGNDEELVRLLVASPTSEYERWREMTVNSMLASKLQEKRIQAEAKRKPVDKVKLTVRERSAIEQALAPTMFDALHANTDELRKAGWNRPPACEWIDYVCKRDHSNPLPSRKHAAKTNAPTIARFALVSSVLPRLTDALWIGERARTYIMGCSKRQSAGHCSEAFSGKSADGSLRSAGAQTHSHAHYFPESLGSNSQGRITHLTVFVPAGISLEDEAALSRFTHMHGRNAHDFQIVPLGVGVPGDFGGIEERKAQSPLLATSRVWVSRTPFVPTDHLRIRNSERQVAEVYAQALMRELSRVVRKELGRRPWLAGLKDVVQIERTYCTVLGGTKTSWVKFRRERQRGNGVKSTSEGFGFRLIFPRPVEGPIALGYGSHFGLGQFAAATAEDSHLAS